MSHLHEPSTGLIHADTHNGNDYALCGMAIEGEGGDEPMVATNRRIDCPDCIALIDHCKRIYAHQIKRPQP